MSNLDEVRQNISSVGSGMWFDYGHQHCGIDILTENGVDTYYVYYGNKTKTYKSIEDLFTDPFFEGKSFKEIIEEIDIDYC